MTSIEPYIDDHGITHAELVHDKPFPHVPFCWLTGWNAERALEIPGWRFSVTCLWCMRGFMRARRF